MSEEIVYDELSAEEAAKDPAAPKRRRLTEETWLEIQEAYETGSLKPAEILKLYNISHSAMTQRWDKVEAATGKRPEKPKPGTVAAAPSPAAPAPAAPAAVVEKFEGKRAGKIERAKTLVDMQLDSVQRMTIKIQKEMEDAKSKRTPAEFENDLKALRTLTIVIKNTKDVRWGVLRVDAEVNEDTLATLRIQDLSDADIAKMQAKHAEEDDEDEDLPDGLELDEDDAE